MGPLQKKNKIIILLILMLILSLSCVFAKSINEGLKNFLVNYFSIIECNDRLLVHFISVGQGDAIAINTPNDEVILIDTGPNDATVTFSTYIKEKVINNHLDNTIDYLILTHADADHIGGALRLLNEFEVENIYLPIIDSTTQTYLELIDFIEKGDYNLITDLIDLSNDIYDIQIFGPYDASDENDTCPIIKLEYLDVSFLFTGDISTDIEEQLILDYFNEIDSDIIKIAHHGSKYSSSLEFLEAVSPEYAVISCGNNSYGHPTDVVINNIKEVGANLLRTDIDGDILFSVSTANSYDVLTNEYNITGLMIDYRFFVLVIDLIIIVCIFMILLKKEKHK